MIYVLLFYYLMKYYFILIIIDNDRGCFIPKFKNYYFSNNFSKHDENIVSLQSMAYHKP
jgi:hypothetical protein